MVCWICKGFDVFCLIEEKGECGYFDFKWVKYGFEIVNLIGCVDCYDIKLEDFKEGKFVLCVVCLYVLCVLESVGWIFENLDK